MENKNKNFVEERIEKLDKELNNLKNAQTAVEKLNLEGYTASIQKDIKNMSNQVELYKVLKDKLDWGSLLNEKLYISKYVYFSFDIVDSLLENKIMLLGHFYFETSLLEELYQNYYASASELNKMIHDVLTSVLNMLLPEKNLIINGVFF